MSLPKLDTTATPDALYDAIAAYVQQVDALVEKREAVELAGLDTAIRALCDGVMKLPVEQARAYGDKLEALMGTIEAMQGKMVALQNDIASTMKSLGKQKQAAKAYLSTPGVKDS